MLPIHAFAAIWFGRCWWILRLSLIIIVDAPQEDMTFDRNNNELTDMHDLIIIADVPQEDMTFI